MGFHKNFKKKRRLIWNSISFHTFAIENREEEFVLIATSLKNAKAETLL